MKRFLYITILLTLAALALCACSLTPESVLEVIAPAETPKPGSDLTFTGVVESTPEPVTIAYSEMDGIFCPFWAETDGDLTVAALTQLALLSDGTREAPAEITRIDNEDGSTTVRIALRPGLVCADDVPLTADDLIFTYYVMLDEDYDGPYQLKTLPIRGLSAYWNGIDPDMYSKYVFLYEETYRGGKYDSELKDDLDKAKAELQRQGVTQDRWMNNTTYRNAYQALKKYDSNRAEEIREAIDDAWRRDADALVDYIMTNYSSSITIGTEYTLEEIWETEGLPVVFTMRDRSVGELQKDGSFVSASGKKWDLLTEFPTSEDLFDEMYALYKGDAEQYWQIEGVGRTNMLAAVENDLILFWASQDPDWHGSVRSVSGLERIDECTVAVTLDYCDEAVERALTNVYVTPLHAYGSTDLYDYDNNSFGFTKGDLKTVRLNEKIALGAGEFVYESTDFRTVYFSANPKFWLGKNSTDTIILAREEPAIAEQSAEEQPDEEQG